MRFVKKTKTTLLVAVIPALLMAALGVKLFLFPSVKDAWFEMDEESLSRVPPGLLIIRPTHFSRSLYRRGVTSASIGQDGSGPWNIMGRDVSLRDIIAAAYDENAARVVLPLDAPTNHFDFIATATDSRQRLAKAVRSEFGYTVHKETRDTGVLALKVENTLLPGLVISSAGETRNAFYKHGQYFLTHFQLKLLLPDFEQFLKTPVVDETGLTNNYDFSLPWNIQLVQQFNNEATARPALDKILATLGLGFETETASLEMLVVKKE